MNELDKDLAAIKSRLDSKANTAPPDLVDLAVRNKARQDLQTTRPRHWKWLGGLATASVIVLAATLVIQNGQPTGSNGADLESARMRSAPLKANRELPAAAADEADHSLMMEKPTVADQNTLMERSVLSAEDWVVRLYQLKASGDAEELNSELEAFSAAYPDYKLPEDLELD